MSARSSVENGEYGVEFSFDDGSTDFAEVGPQRGADFYAEGFLGLSLRSERAAKARLTLSNCAIVLGLQQAAHNPWSVARRIMPPLTLCVTTASAEQF